MFDSWGLPSRFRVASTPWLVVVNRLARASASMFSQAPAADEVFRARRRQLPALTWPGVRHRSVVAPRSGRPQLLAHDDDDGDGAVRSEEHTSELQSRGHLVCRLLLEKKKKNTPDYSRATLQW